MTPRDWSLAERVADDMLARLNVELARMRREKRMDLLQLFAAQVLVLRSIADTMPATGRPRSLVRLLAAVDDVLEDLDVWHEQQGRSREGR